MKTSSTPIVDSIFYKTGKKMIPNKYLVCFIALLNISCSSGGSDEQGEENKAGKLDITFGDSGVFGLGNFNGGDGSYWDRGYSIAFDANNDMYITGSFNRVPSFSDDPQNFDMFVAKLDFEGQLDPSFGNAGILLVGEEKEQRGWDVKITQDENVLILGMSDNMYGYDNLSLWKILPSGDFDHGFGLNGVVTVSASSNTTHYNIKKMVIDDANRILVAGAIEKYSGDLDMVLMRFLPNGELDPDFATGGIYTYDSLSGNSGEVQATDLAVDSDGNIVVSGYGKGFINTYDLVVWKFNPDGTLFTEFGSNGIFINCGLCDLNRIGENGGTAVSIDDQNRILIAGWLLVEGYPSSRVIMWRFDQQGNLDKSFGLNGIIIDMTERNQTSDVEIDAEGKIVLAAQGRGRNGWPDMLLFRYLDNGLLDPSFGISGKKIYAEIFGTCCIDSVVDLNIDHDGNYFLIGNSERIIAGTSSLDIAVIKAVH